MPQFTRTAAFALAVAITGPVAIAAGTVYAGVPATATIAQLAGRWTGPGVVVPATGPSEKFKCVVTYVAASAGARVRQNLRCRNKTYNLDAATHLRISGNRVTGRWQENTHSVSGTVSGTVTRDGFNIFLAGRFFQARMNVSGTGCIQSVKVSPSSKDRFRQITAALKRC